MDPIDAPTTTAAPDTGRPYTVTGEHPDAERRLRDLDDLIEVIRPVIAADGGQLDVRSVDLSSGVVRLELSGACGTCAVSSTTLNQGVDRILRDRLDWVTAVEGTVAETDISGYGGWTPR